jgi:hypothetical protein
VCDSEQDIVADVWRIWGAFFPRFRTLKMIWGALDSKNSGKIIKNTEKIQFIVCDSEQDIVAGV